LPTLDLGTVAMVEPVDREPRMMKVEGKHFSFLFYVFFFFSILVTSRVVGVYSKLTNPSKLTQSNPILRFGRLG